MTFDVTVEDLKKVWIGNTAFPEDQSEQLLYLKDLILEEIETLLAKYDRNIDYDLHEGKLRPLSLKNLIASIVKRTWESAQTSELDGFSQVSQNANGYGVSLSPVQAEYSIYFKKAELRKLGIASRRITTFP